jgi:hypothetical protein
VPLKIENLKVGYSAVIGIAKTHTPTDTMATLTIPLADQYTDGAGRPLFRFAQFTGLNVHGREHKRMVRENYHREVDSNTVVMLKPLVRHIQHETGAILPKALGKMLKHELKTFCAEHLAFEVEAPPPQPVRRLYTVILNLSFRQGEEPEQDSWESDEQYAEHLRLFHEMEVYLETHPIEAHVKRNDPKAYVEFLTDGILSEVISAEWLDGFRISFTVDSLFTADELRTSLIDNSLEDGEYESGSDNGWTIKTLTGNWEIGLVDYRRNPIEIEEIIM